MAKKIIISFAVIAVAFVAIVAVLVGGKASAPSAAIKPVPPGSAPPAGDGILEGRVFLGPTCPMEHIPPLPGCAPRPYATTILVFAADNNAAPVATFATDASGTFSAALPAGAYVIQAKGGSSANGYLPRCGSTEVTVAAGAAATTTLNCDTGIR